MAYKARRAVLLEGPTGVGKSEIVRRVANDLGIETTILDLSLLEPPDLVGLPVVKDGRTEYALPHVLPRGGAGILLLEELNRAERYIQQPQPRPSCSAASVGLTRKSESPTDWAHGEALQKNLALLLSARGRLDLLSSISRSMAGDLAPGVSPATDACLDTAAALASAGAADARTMSELSSALFDAIQTQP